MSFTVIGCSTFKSSIMENQEKQGIYQGDERLAFQLAYKTMEKIFPGNPINDIDGPIRGFSGLETFGPDWYSTALRIIPAIAKDENNKEIFGYYYEVSGEGTIPIGPNKDAEVYSLYKEYLKKELKYTNASGILRSEYKLDRDRWRLSESIIPKNNEQKSKEERLNELKILFEKGLINEDEYALGKNKIIME